MRLAVIADIHGNCPALEAVAADLKARHVDRIVNLGDCVSGPLWPRETLDFLRARDWPTVRGNHDRWVGLDPAQSLSPTDAFAAGELDAEGRRWLANLPVRIAVDDVTIAFHARPDDDNAYLLEEIEGGRLVPARAPTIKARLAGVTARVVLAAHSHLAAVVRLPDGRWIVNPGSVGCPAYDDPTAPAHVSESGSPAARYAIIDLDPSAVTGERLPVELLAIPYDHPSARRRAETLGRPDWARALATGFMGAREMKDPA